LVQCSVLAKGEGEGGPFK